MFFVNFYPIITSSDILRFKLSFKIILHDIDLIKLFFSAAYVLAKCFYGKPFQTVLIFMGKDGCLPNKGDHSLFENVLPD